MNLALIADVHASLEALTACLADARERKAERFAERFAFLGDLVGYGADPGAVVDTIASLLAHASPGAPVARIHVTDPLRAARALSAAAPSWVFRGHAHEPVLYTRGAAARPVPFRPAPGVAIPVPPRRQGLAVVGSTGQPRDGNAAACYAMLDTDRATLTFLRVPQDWRAAADEVRGAGLPESVARRIERGE